MTIFSKLFAASSLLTVMVAPALAGVNINYPANKSDVESPFKLSATAATCAGEDVSVVGYSLDSSADSKFFEGTSVDTTVEASAGTHTVHVKAWTAKDAVCVTDVAVTVTATVPVGSALASPNAVINSSLEALSNWKAVHDTGGVGGASGWMTLVTSPSVQGTSRLFASSFSHSGDERYSLSFGDDATSANFLYSTYIYLNASSQKIGVIEMDMNQVLTNGKTVIYGFQCDGWSGTWDYAGNTHGAHPATGWIHTGLPCNPRSWKINTWHHVQVSYSRDATGNVTYHSVTFDGVTHPVNKTVYSAYSLGWGHGSLITNFQVDGFGASGSNTVYIDQLSISRW